MTHDDFQSRIKEAYEMGRMDASHEIEDLMNDVDALRVVIHQLLDYIAEHGEPIGDEAVAAYRVCKAAYRKAMDYVYAEGGK